MAHPYENYRNDKVERSRVGKMFGPECRIERACGGETMKHRGRGGAMRYAEEDPGGDPQATQPKEFLSKLARKAKAVKDGGMAGKRPKHRMDRKHRARGGRAHHADEAEDRARVREMVKPEARKERARGGRNRKGGKTVVNIHVAPPHGGGDLGSAGLGLGGSLGAKPPMASPPPPMPAGGPPPGAGGPLPMPPAGAMGGAPPMGGGAPMPPPGGRPLPPGMMPPRAKGGRVAAGFGAKPAKPMRAPKMGNAGERRGVKGQGPGDFNPGESEGWKQSQRNKTPVQHADGKKDGSRLTGPNMRRVGGHGKEPHDQYAGFRR